MSGVSVGAKTPTKTPAKRSSSSGRRGAVDRESGLYSGGFGPRDRSQRRENGREKPAGRFSGPGDHSGPISDHFLRLWARPPVCDLNIVILPQLRRLRLEHCVLRLARCLFLQQKTFVLSHQKTSVLPQQQTSVLPEEQTSVLSQQ